MFKQSWENSRLQRLLGWVVHNWRPVAIVLAGLAGLAWMTWVVTE